MFYTYVIHNSIRKKIYIGHTENLERRLARHNGILTNKKTSYTAKNAGAWKIVYVEIFQTRSEAMRRERQLKTAQGRAFVKTHISSVK